MVTPIYPLTWYQCNIWVRRLTIQYVENHVKYMKPHEGFLGRHWIILFSGAGMQNSSARYFGTPVFTCAMFWLQILRCAAP